MKRLAEFSSEISNESSLKTLGPSLNLNSLMAPNFQKPEEKYKEKQNEPKTSRTGSIWSNNMLSTDDLSIIEEKALMNPTSIE